MTTPNVWPGAAERVDAALAAIPKLESLTFKNAAVSPEAAAATKAAKAWKKLDLGK